MSLRQVLLIIALAVWCMNITFNCGTHSDPLTFNVKLNVPYHAQEYCNFCGVACVKMWAHYDDWELPQTEIASYMSVVPNGPGADIYELERAVGAYTWSPGFLARKEFEELGAQGDLISSAIEGMDYSVPAIMPFDWGEHAVLLIGFKWIEKDDGTPYALSCYYHDPDNLPDRIVTPAQLSARFDPTPFYYWVLLGHEDFLVNGTFGHDSFVLQHGTYYGGPAVYNPKDLDIGIPTN